MRNNPIDFVPDLTPAEQTLIAHLVALCRAEEQMPPDVAFAATALHDWVDVDGQLAELAADPVLVRSDDAAFVFHANDIRLRIEVAPAGYRRRRVTVHTLCEAGAPAPEEMAIQFPDGATQAIPLDRFGDHVGDLPAGTMRLMAVGASGGITTPWFTI